MSDQAPSRRHDEQQPAPDAVPRGLGAPDVTDKVRRGVSPGTVLGALMVLLAVYLVATH